MRMGKRYIYEPNSRQRNRSNKNLMCESKDKKVTKKSMAPETTTVAIKRPAKAPTGV
jgi:hypothetical protein